MNIMCTKGPWKVCAGQSHFHVVAEQPGFDAFPRYVCRVQDDNIGLADARLIASAPELLAALESLLETAPIDIGADNVDDYRAFVKRVSAAAIAKANGGGL